MAEQRNQAVGAAIGRRMEAAQLTGDEVELMIRLFQNKAIVEILFRVFPELKRIIAMDARQGMAPPPPQPQGMGRQMVPPPPPAPTSGM